jgi:hypothetical protein
MGKIGPACQPVGPRPVLGFADVGYCFSHAAVSNLPKETHMSKLLSTLIFAAVATFGLNAQAASHAGGAPMKASEPAAKASAPAKKEAKKEGDKKEAKKETKKEADKK